MARKTVSVKPLTDEEIIRISRIRVTESAAATFTQISQDTQLSIERGVIWMIHFIEFNFGSLNLLTEVAAAGSETVDCQVTRESKTAIIPGNDTDLIQAEAIISARSAAIGTDAGPLWVEQSRIKRYDYLKPLPYASQNIHVGVLGSDATGMHVVDVRIGYTIREVGDQYFFRVAQALLG